MLNKHYTNKILFLNIETCPQYAKLEDASPKLQEVFKKRFTHDILQELGKNAYVNNESGTSALHNVIWQEKAALHSEFGRIACISFLAMNDKNEYRVASITDPDEKVLIEKFLKAVTSISDWKKGSDSAVCSYAGFGFSWPFLAQRCLVNGIQIPAMFDYSEGKPWEQEHLISLSNVWNYNRSQYVSLDALATMFGVESHDHPENVSGWFYELPTSLKEYAENRVLTLATTYLRIKGIKDELKKQ